MELNKIVIGKKEYKLVIKTRGVEAIESKLKYHWLNGYIDYIQSMAGITNEKGEIDTTKIKDFSEIPSLKTEYRIAILYGALQQYNSKIGYDKTIDLIDQYLDEEHTTQELDAILISVISEHPDVKAIIREAEKKLQEEQKEVE